MHVLAFINVLGGESSSLRVKDKASLDNSGQFFLFKGKFNFPGFHCSAVASFLLEL